MKLKYMSKLLATPFCLIALVLLGSAFTVRADDISVSLSDGWQFTNGPEYPGADGKFTYNDTAKALELSYDFSKGGQYVAVSRTLSSTESLSGVKIVVSGPGGGLTVALIDSGGQTLLYRLGTIDTAPRTIELKLASPSDAYGGADDKVVHYPLKGMRLTVEKGSTTAGKLSFTAVTLEPAAPTPTPTP